MTATTLSSFLAHVPKGKALARQVEELEDAQYAHRVRAQLQRGLEAAKDPDAPRTTHADFMDELKTRILNRINER